jgi:hypothetical protein
MASDTEITNVPSQKAHVAAGYEPAGSLVHYRKRLTG